jgi:TRAP-type C4-dicarboxylate transport system permease small subunit
MALTAAAARFTSDVLNRIAEGVTTVTFAAMTFLVIVDVLLRNLGTPIAWSEEVGVRFLGSWFVFLGASVAFKRGQHISIMFVVAWLNPRWQRVVGGGGGLLIAGFLCLMVYYGLDLVQFTFSQPSPILGIPMGYAYLSIPVSSAIMLVHSLAAAVEARPAPARLATVGRQDLEAEARDA